MDTVNLRSPGKRMRATTLVLGAIAGLMMCGTARGQAPIIPLYTFSGTSTVPEHPIGRMVRAGDGNFYGVCNPIFERSLEIYRLTASGQCAVIASINATEFGQISGQLAVGSDGALYAVSQFGGRFGQSAIMRCSLSGVLTTVARFGRVDTFDYGATLTSGGTGGWYVIGSGSNAVSTAIYHVDAAGDVAPVVTFDPSGPLRNSGGALTLGADGYLYGADDYPGRLFRASSASGAELLHQFSKADGNPSGPPVMAPDGTLYGLTDKVLYSATAAGGYSVVARLPGGLTGFGTPAFAAGMLFGVLEESGGHGAIFEAKTGGSFLVVHYFSGSDGTTPYDLAAGTDGYLYGACNAGGAVNYGTLWRVSTSGAFQLLSQLHDSNRVGTYPVFGLTLGPDDNMFLAAEGGGYFDAGVAVEFDRSGTPIPRLSFPAGTIPLSAITVDTTGELVGTSTANPNYPYLGSAQLYAIDDEGNQRTLHTWTGSPAPTSGLTLSPNRVQYGTETDGVYSISSSDEYSLLEQFIPAGYTENVPTGGLTAGPDGALYGVVASNYVTDGLVYRITTAGSVTVIHRFSGADGGNPLIPPTLGPDGALYGSTEFAGPNEGGVIYRLTAQGVFTLLHVFGGTPEVNPFGALTAGTDGWLYGFCDSAGRTQSLIYRIDAGGHFGIVAALPTQPTPANPVGSLQQIGPDLFYADGGDPAGIASAGGGTPKGQPQNSPFGAIFRVDTGIGDHDFAANGNADILLQNTKTADVTAWTMAGVQHTGALDLTPGLSPDWRLVCSADLNLDGKPDLLLQNRKTGELDYWLMDGSKHIGSGTLAVNVSSGWRPVCVTDLDASDRPYLLWQNTATGSIVWWHLDGVNVTNKGVLTNAVPAGDLLIAAGDLSGSGYPDLVFQNSASGTLFYWAMQGTNITSQGYLATQIDPAWNLVGVVTMNGDYQPDLLWWNEKTGDIVYWLMDGFTVSSTGTVGRAPAGWQPAEQ